MSVEKISRRAWFKRGALATGALLTSQSIVNDLFARPALGMMPLRTPALFEPYPIPAQDMMELKARLLANENPWGPSKKAISAIGDSAELGNRYVYSSSIKMIEVLAEKEKVDVNQVLLAAGSTDLLEKTAFSLCMKGGNVISADPSYLSLVKTAQAIGATWKNIRLRADYSHDLEAMEQAIDADTKLIYICNPNNPTGTLTAAPELKSFIRKINSRVPIFIDEAYLELLNDADAQTTVGLVAEGYDLIVSRTFSKIHGMAGLRMGYMVARPERVKAIQSLVRTEMGVCVTSLKGAMASLKDMKFQEYTRTHNIANREYTFSELNKLGLSPIPSVANFILFPIQMPTKDFVSQMLEHSVGVRGFEIEGKPFGRVSIGTMDEMKLFVKSLESVLASSATQSSSH